MDDSTYEDLETKLAELLARRPAVLDPSKVADYVARHLERRDGYLRIWEENGRRPAYVLDRESLTAAAARFRQAFLSRIPEVGFFYAVKSNSHPEIAATLVESGFGLDVSSGLELRTALAAGARQIVFSGPGKTEEELSLAVAHSDQTTVLIDSFGELERLAGVTAAQGRSIRAGVRLTPPVKGAWRKFGIPLLRLGEFWQAAEMVPFVHLEGIQFHASWNMSAEAQVETIAALGEELARWPKWLSRQIRFLDIGGGFWPERGEWLQEGATDQGRIETILGTSQTDSRNRYFVPAEPIERFAAAISEALRRRVFPHVRCRLCVEPGRWICNDAMHILVSVADKKENDLVITDAGTNAVGWERFEQDYVPIINLTRPALEERPCLVLGSLCTPHDFWGYGYWGTDIQFDDVLLIPDQGAYTYSLRQEFIKPLPNVVTGW